MHRFIGIVPALLTLIAASAADNSLTPALSITSDFEGGSAQIEYIDQAARSIRISPTAHGGRGWACW